MRGTERRAAIVEVLRASQGPVSGAALAEMFGVSRQVVVQDMALIRSTGVEVAATNRGYVIEGVPAVCERPSRLFKVRHTVAQSADELNAVVDLGGTVEDVMVNHRTYGRLSAPLGVKCRRDVARFIADLEAGISSPLMTITDGYHFHRVSADTPEILDEIEGALRALGFIAACTEYEKETFGDVASQ